jgi:hypothetical protein
MVKRKTQRRAVTPVLRRGTYTADHAMDKLIGAIKQEPGRLRMRWWISFLRGKNLLLSGLLATAPRFDIPACGTVACAAGWINIITRNTDTGRDGTSALNKLLGRSTWDEQYASDVSELVAATGFRSEMHFLFMQTEWHAPRVTKELRRIQMKYSELLKSRKVVVS